MGFQQVDVIESWLPLFLFAILYGLSMDYQVFLLSRVRERFRQTGDDAEAVIFGLRTTAGSSEIQSRRESLLQPIITPYLNRYIARSQCIECRVREFL